MNDGHPVSMPYSRAKLLAALTGAALTFGALGCTTLTASGVLDVNHATTGDNAALLRNTHAAGYGPVFRGGGGSTGLYHALFQRYDGTEVARITGDGVLAVAGQLYSSKASAAAPITDANSSLKLYDPSLGAGLFGMQTSGSPYAFQLQVADATMAAYFPLHLQPRGGAVILGPDPSGGAILRIGGSITLAAAQAIYSGGEATANLRCYFDAGNSYWRAPSGGHVWQNSAGTNRMTLSDAGHLAVPVSVAVGFAGPAARPLDVYGSAQFKDASGIGTTIWSEAVTGAGGMGTNTNHPFALLTNGIERGRITTAGAFVFGTDPGGSAILRAGGDALIAGLVNISRSGQSTIWNGTTGTYCTWQYNGTPMGDIGTADEVIAGGATTDFGVSSRAGDLLFGLNGSLRMKLSTPAAGETSLWLYDADNGALERVTVGAADSMGAGFKGLRIPN